MDESESIMQHYYKILRLPRSTFIYHFRYKNTAN